MNGDEGKKHIHYRNVFKSDHLGVADLEDYTENGSNLIFTIDYVNQEFGTKVAGRKTDANIAYFKESIKPMVVNAGNCEVLKKMTGTWHLDEWKNIPVQLYIDPDAKYKGERVGGVRINPNPPRIEKKELQAGTKQYDNAVKAYKRDGNLNVVTDRVIVSKELEKQIKLDAAEQIKTVSSEENKPYKDAAE